MSGLGGGLATRRCGSLVIGGPRDSLKGYILRYFLLLKFGPDRCVIGWFLALAHFAVYPGSGTLSRKRFVCQNRVDAQAAILRKGKHPIIPPAKKTALLMMKPQRVDQTDITQLPEGGALAIGTHDCTAPQFRIICVPIFRSDIEIAADDKLAIFFVRQAFAESHVPIQFVLVGRRSHCLAIRRVNGIETEIVDLRRDDAGLSIDNFIAKRSAHVLRFLFRKDRNSVVRFLSMIRGVITGRLQGERGELFVGAFRFLQTNDVRLRAFEPGKETILALAQ